MTRRVGRNSLWLMGQPLILNVISILSTGYITRTLGPESFGAFNLGLAQVALFTPLCNLGLRAVAVRAIAQNRENAAEVVRAIYALRVLTTTLAVFLAVAWLLLATSLSYTTRLIGFAFVVSMICTSNGHVAIDLFQGFERSKLAAQPQIIGGLVLTGLSVLALVAGLGLPGFVAAYVLGAFIQLLLLRGTARREFFPIWPIWDWPRIRGFIRQIGPFALMSQVNGWTTISALDVVWVGMAFGDTVVGPYSAAVMLIGKLLVVPHGIGDALYPAVAHGYHKDPGEVTATIRRYVLNLAMISLPVAVGLSFAAPTVLWILFGSKYLSAADPMRVAVWVLPLAGANYLIRECLSGVHKQGVVAKLTIVSGVVMIGLFALLIPRYGTTGAALAMVAAEGLMLCVWMLPFRTAFGRAMPWSGLLKVAGAVAAMCLPLGLQALRYTHVGAVLCGLLGLACYAAVLVALGLVKVDRRAILGRLRARRSGG